MEEDPIKRTLGAWYANYFEVGFNELEVLMDFGQSYGDEHPPAIHTRIVASPAHAKAFLELLSDALGKHARKFGPPAEGSGG